MFVVLVVVSVVLVVIVPVVRRWLLAVDPGAVVLESVVHLVHDGRVVPVAVEAASEAAQGVNFSELPQCCVKITVCWT